MIKHEAGLHKDVATIFSSVWNPQIDNDQSKISPAYKDSGAFVHPNPLSNDLWPEKAKNLQKTNHSHSPWSFFSPKARREKKRLSAISKHLLINIPD
jgi:hypothetical protein